MKKSNILVIALIILLFLSGFVGTSYYFLSTPTIKNDGVIYYLKPGTSKQTFIADLTQQKIITHPSLFLFYIYAQTILSSTHLVPQLKAGEYFFPKGSTSLSIIKQVTNGTGLYYRSFTILPGWTFAQLRKALLYTHSLRHQLNKLSDKQVMQSLGSQADLSPEGEFFPETYYYTRGVLDLVILKRAFDLMQSRSHEVWQTRITGLPYKNEYDVLIAASLIEKEAYLKTEMPMIAGVLVNRLRKNMLLQFDPTVIYGMGERYTGKIHKTDLQEDTIYNTYTRKGLPPTPIAMPSMASLTAATHPESNDYFYFVAKGDGAHQFSKTLVEHNKAVGMAIKQTDYYFNETKIKQHLNGLLTVKKT